MATVQAPAPGQEPSPQVLLLCLPKTAGKLPAQWSSLLLVGRSLTKSVLRVMANFPPQVRQSQPGFENCWRGPNRRERVPLAGEIHNVYLVSGLIFLKQVGLISNSGSRRPFCGGTLVIKMIFCTFPHYRASIVFRSAPKRCSQLLTAQHQGEQTMW